MQMLSKHNKILMVAIDVLFPFISNSDKEPVCVELFARCLSPGWISWGNECLKFQHLNYFSKDQ